MIVQIRHEVPVFASYAAERTRGLYNVDAADGRRFELDVDVPVEREGWQIGVVVGPSGSGKTSIARALHDAQWKEWVPSFGCGGSDQKPIIEALTDNCDSYAKATAALAAVGLGSVPSWLRPYRVLSNGEQFRASMADLLIETAGYNDLTTGQYYLDEFTSVLDRQVAKVGAGAFAKQWRRTPGRRVILITCHADILDWVEPDWVLDTSEGLNKWGQDRQVVRAQEPPFRVGEYEYGGDEIGRIRREWTSYSTSSGPTVSRPATRDRTRDPRD